MRKFRLKKMYATINSIYGRIIGCILSYRMARKELQGIVAANNIILKRAEGENEWLELWGNLSKKVNKNYYRLYAQYVGNDINIVPDEISHNIIEKILNPFNMMGCISDKNLFDRILALNFSEPVTPKTLFRIIDGHVYDGGYNKINDLNISLSQISQDKIVAKPSVFSNSGKNVILCERTQNSPHNKSVFQEKITGITVDYSKLKELLGSNFIIQEYFRQSDYLAQFCPTSVNTIRVATYRSVITDDVEVLNCVLRVGSDGSYIDNIHAGGKFTPISKEGVIGGFVCNEKGVKIKEFNGVDFENAHYVIPEFDKIKEFAKKVANTVPHMRLLQLDISLNDNNEPMLIEYNMRSFAPWFYQLAGNAAFGNFAKEIIDYCKNHKEDAVRVLTLV